MLLDVEELVEAPPVLLEVEELVEAPPVELDVDVDVEDDVDVDVEEDVDDDVEEEDDDDECSPLDDEDDELELPPPLLQATGKSTARKSGTANLWMRIKDSQWPPRRPEQGKHHASCKCEDARVAGRGRGCHRTNDGEPSRTPAGDGGFDRAPTAP